MSRRALLCLALAVLGCAAVPVASAAAAPVPLIIDTDMFSDPDDTGALATAFGLQLKQPQEANVLAIGVNARLSRSMVSTDSWKCVAAITDFYGFGTIPVGSLQPDDDTDAWTPDWTAPCADLAPAATPDPGSAVALYQSVLSAQPDHSVVMVSVGYMGNLSALLNASPALVQAKVKTLVVMAGGYPSRAGETNLQGHPAAAQNIADNWPTKIVWSGYEVGNAFHTGSSLETSHPADSPVRASYETFAEGGSWGIGSFDLTAVYHAVRPTDPAMHEVGPGTNSVSNTGANTFSLGAGNQYYLALDDAADLKAKITALIDKTTPDPPPPPPPPTDTTQNPPPTTTTTTSPPTTTTPPAPAETPTTPTEAATPLPETGPTATTSGATTTRVSLTDLRTGAGRSEAYRGSMSFPTPASWVNARPGRFSVTRPSGCKATVLVGARGAATARAASAQVLAGTAQRGKKPRFGSGPRTGGAWAVGSTTARVLRGRAAVRKASRRFLLVTADATLSKACRDADAKVLAAGLKTLVRTADVSRVRLVRLRVSR